MATALSATRKTSFNIRQKYRVNVTSFCTMDLSVTAVVESLARSDGEAPGVPGKGPAQGAAVGAPLKATAVNSFRPTAPADPEADDGGVEGGHRPYYILTTKEVNAFVAADVNHWLLCLEALISRVDPGPEGLLPAEPAHQLVNEVLVSVITRTLHLLLSGNDPSMQPSV